MKTLRSLVSTRVSLVLLLAFAVAMAIATFIENDHGTQVARLLVYEAWWFELILIWLSVNFIANIGKYKLFSSNRWPIGLFHLAFVVIVLGAGVTRYFSQEGMVHIREGQSVNTFLTNVNYLIISEVSESPKHKHYERSISLNPYNYKPLINQIELSDKTFDVVFDQYIKNAKEEIIDGNETFMDLAWVDGDDRQDIKIRSGEIYKGNKSQLSFNSNTATGIQVFKTDSTWKIYSEYNLHSVEMASQKMGAIAKGDTAQLSLRTMYQWDGGAMVVKGIHENKTVSYTQESDEEKAKDLLDVVKIQVKESSGKLITEYFSTVNNRYPENIKFNIDDKAFNLRYGAKELPLPFSISLTKFDLDRYPGSQSPSSYASEVKVKDEDGEFEFRIFMNNVLDHRGFRFYQASYDTDEKGTVLSINQDRPGTYITYFGYFLLTLGMILSLFFAAGRFKLLNSTLKNLDKGKQFIWLFTALTLSTSVFANDSIPDIKNSIVPHEKVEVYQQLIVQDLDGRMKPVNTLANEIARKVYGRTKVKIEQTEGSIELSSGQFLLGVQMNPVGYSHLPLIKVDQEKGKLIFDKLGVNKADHIAFAQFIDNDGKYLLNELVEKTNRLKPAERNESHKEILKTDERFNIFYGLLTGDFLRLFPKKDDSNNTWFTSQQSKQGFTEEDASFVKNISNLYLIALEKGIRTGDWEEADEILGYIDLYQKTAGESVYPSAFDVSTELHYNKLNLGNRLFGIFWILGLAMLIVSIAQLFISKKFLNSVYFVGIIFAWLGQLAFSYHLTLRWIIAKHPPWSDGFEMLIFVAWGTLLSGLLFSKRSRFTVPVGLLFSGTLLFVAFLDWLNPEITNLMPVLHSYWLKIHVAVIVGSYAPLALSAMLAFLMLTLLIFKPAEPQSRWWSSMKELSIVSEISVTVGLFLLTIGTFLGGVWANESWGRYWAWDPKETWALISVIIYSIVLHLRLIPGTRNALIFNIAVLWSFSSIVMTSFGVNYYLSGLHSYAKGDPVPIPQWVYYAFFILVVITLISILKYRKLSEQERNKLLVSKDQL